MSLINEALKRTRDASHQSSSRPTSHRATARPQSARFVSFTALLVTAVVGVLALSGTRVMTSRVSTHMAPVIDAFEPAPLNVPNETETQTTVAQTPKQPVVEVKTTPAESPPPAAPVVAAAPEPPLPQLLLQGITSEGEVFEAMINNVNLRQGDDIEGARVTSIESRRVRLKFGDREILLRLR